VSSLGPRTSRIRQEKDSILHNPSLFLFWGGFVPEKEEKKAQTPLIDLAERATVRLVRLVFKALRAVVSEAKRLVLENGESRNN